MVTRGLYQVPCQLKSQKVGLPERSSARPNAVLYQRSLVMLVV